MKIVDSPEDIYEKIQEEKDEYKQSKNRYLENSEKDDTHPDDSTSDSDNLVYDTAMMETDHHYPCLKRLEMFTLAPQTFCLLI